MIDFFKIFNGESPVEPGGACKDNGHPPRRPGWICRCQCGWVTYLRGRFM